MATPNESTKLKRKITNGRRAGDVRRATKDLITKEVLLFNQSKDGLYVLSESSATLCPKLFCLLVYPPLPMFGIVDSVTQAPRF